MSEFLIYFILYFAPLITLWSIVIYDVRNKNYQVDWEDVGIVTIPILNLVVCLYGVYAIVIPSILKKIGLDGKIQELRGGFLLLLDDAPNKFFFVKKG